MGRRKLRLTRFELGEPSKGYFPNLDFDEVPDGGSYDCKHSIWKKSELRKFPGMDRINSSQAAGTRGNGLFYLDVNGSTARTYVFANAIYSESAGTLTDRTGAVTITNSANNLWQFINHQQGANRYMIGVNGVDAPIRWTGAGNAAVLGGAPPILSSIAKYHDTVFGFTDENLYFSATGDPETWNTGVWVIPFEFNGTKTITLGEKLLCFTRRNCGTVQGYDYLDFVAAEAAIPNVGCVGRLAACNVYFGNQFTKAVATIADDGIWLVDEGLGVQKIIGDDYFEDFNKANLHKATCAYWELERLLFVALPKDDTENDYLLVIDMKTGAVWPAPEIHGNSIRSIVSMKDDNGNEFLYFVDANGYAFKFNFETRNYHTGTATEAIDFRWKSKRYDLKDIHFLRGAYLLADAEGDYNVIMSIAFNLSTGDGSSGTINLQGDADLLGSTFVLGASVLGGSDYVFENLSGIYPFGRFLSITFENNELDESVSIKKCELHLKRRRMGANES